MIVTPLAPVTLWTELDMLVDRTHEDAALALDFVVIKHLSLILGLLSSVSICL